MSYDDEIFEFLRDCQDFDEYELFLDKHGTSNICPDNLDNYIHNFGNLMYNLHSNNCQHFVNFCRKKLDPNARIVEMYNIKVKCVSNE